MKISFRFLWILLTVVALAGLSACSGSSNPGSSSTSTGSGGSTTPAPTPNPSLSGAVIDGKVSGATLTLYSDLAMTTQVGSGSTDSTGAFSITLTVSTAPDPIYIKSAGGKDIDTGMPAPTMMFVGNTTGANALTTFNVTPLTKDVFDRVNKGATLSGAQTDARVAFGLSSNTGSNGLYEDPTASGNSTLKAAAFKKLAAGTTGGTIAAGSYKMFAITVSDSDIGTTGVASITSLIGGSNFVSGDITVSSTGTISGTSGGKFITGKVAGSSVVLNIQNSATAPTEITRVVGNLGLNGSVAGNFTGVSALTTTPAMTKGLFVGSLVPASGINTTGLATFVSDFYTPGATSGNMNIVARDIFIDNVTITVPRVRWGRAALTAVDAAAGTVTMGNMTVRVDAGSVAGGTSTLTYSSGQYVVSGGIPTNVLVFQFTDGATYNLYVATAVGLRRGIYFVVPTAGPTAGKIVSAGESYLSKVDSVAPNPFSSGGTFDVTVAAIHPGMPGRSRTNALSEGLTPQTVGPMTIPSTLTSGTIGNGYVDTTSGAPELMVFQGSMFAMKQDTADTFATNQLTTPAGSDTHMRLVEFFESGAMQGEEIQGGKVPGSATLNMRDFPGNFIGFVHNRASTATPGFSGTLHFLARTIYASSYSDFAGAYTTGTLTITAPTTAAGSATLVAVPAGGTSATSTLTVRVPASGAPGVYHIDGALAGGGYVDIVWPIGGTKALYVVSDSATGTVSEVGEAYITQ